MLIADRSLRFDGRDLSDDAVPDEVVGFGLTVCSTCGTVRDARLPYCCEFAADLEPQVLLPA